MESLIGLIGVFAGAGSTFVIARWRAGGTVRSSEATDLWTALHEDRKARQAEYASLRQEYDKQIARLQALEIQLDEYRKSDLEKTRQILYLEAEKERLEIRVNELERRLQDAGHALG